MYLVLDDKEIADVVSAVIEAKLGKKVTSRTISCFDRDGNRVENFKTTRMYFEFESMTPSEVKTVAEDRNITLKL